MKEELTADMRDRRDGRLKDQCFAGCRWSWHVGTDKVLSKVNHRAFGPAYRYFSGSYGWVVNAIPLEDETK